MTWIQFGERQPDSRTGRCTIGTTGRRSTGSRTGWRTIRSDDRGASNTVHYVLSLGMATVLFVGLLLAAGNLVDSQRDRAVADELSIAGNRLASDIVAVDGLVRGGDGVTVNEATLSPDLPDTISGEDYVVTITAAGSDPTEVTITLRVTELDVTQTVTTTTSRPVTPGTYHGGDLVVKYDPASDEVVVTSA